MMLATLSNPALGAVAGGVGAAWETNAWSAFFTSARDTLCANSSAVPAWLYNSLLNLISWLILLE